MKKFIPFILLVSAVFATPAMAQRFTEDLDGVNWSKTLRVRGLITRFDPFNETSLYRIGADGKSSNIPARADLVQFEMIASGFWGVLRDSIEVAMRNGKVNIYTLGFPKNTTRTELRVKRTRVTYEDMLDSLSQAFGSFVSPNDRLVQIYDPAEGNVQGMARLVERLRSQTRGKRIITDLRYISVFELELAISVDETGFKIKPTGLIFGTAHWATEATFDPKNILNESMYTGYDTADLRNPKNIGFYLDLTEPKTMRWLIENGMQVSGERNIIPFYDLLTLFHYPYNIYAESNNVLAVGAFAFKDKYTLGQLQKNLLDRYNDMMYQYLYGQAPEWWDQGKRGAFTNGMFELDTLRQAKTETPPETKQPAARGAGGNRGGTEPEPAPTGTGRQGGTQRGGARNADDGGAKQAAPARKQPAAQPKEEEPARPATTRRRKNVN
jgi:hypothetical protein